MKELMQDIMKDGLHEDNVLFERGFAKRYKSFSKSYLGDYFKYNDSNQENIEFILTYDEVVDPSKWRRSYGSIDGRYQKQLPELVFADKQF